MRVIYNSLPNQVLSFNNGSTSFKKEMFMCRNDGLCLNY
jgi:hypothetical protein